MTTYILRRLISGLLLVFLLTLITFALFRLVPAQPWRAILSNPFENYTQADIEAAERKLGLDRPLIVQYGDFIWRIVRHADFGTSYYGADVRQSLETTLPVMWSIVLGGAVLLFLLAVPLATISALRPNSVLDRAILAFSILGVALHPFMIGLGLREVLADRLHLVPGLSTSLYGDPLNYYCPLRAPPPVPPGFTGPDPCGGVRDWAGHLVLPWITFAVIFLPIYMRMLRARIVEVLGEPYILAARAKGTPTVRLLRTHVLRNALLQPLTMIGMEIGLALTVSIYIETMFNMYGVGTLAVAALGEGTSFSAGGRFDLPILAGIVFTVALSVILLNLLIDLLYGWLDPRVRIRAAAA
jgi:peptide/nickel transport system permease protein